MASTQIPEPLQCKTVFNRYISNGCSNPKNSKNEVHFISNFASGRSLPTQSTGPQLEKSDCRLYSYIYCRVMTCHVYYHVLWIWFLPQVHFTHWSSFSGDLSYQWLISVLSLCMHMNPCTNLHVFSYWNRTSSSRLDSFVALFSIGQ